MRHLQVLRRDSNVEIQVGDTDAAVENRIQIGWNKFRQLVPLLINKDISLIVRVRLYSSCIRSSMLHGSETWPVREEYEVAFQRAEMRMVRWMCGIKLQDRIPIGDQWLKIVLRHETSIVETETLASRDETETLTVFVETRL